MPHTPGHKLVVQKRGWGTHKGFYYRVVDNRSGRVVAKYWGKDAILRAKRAAMRKPQ
tara:strand:+ start:1229 stop:1399 length:171 start_codon:yes stop_codon:yes gene_type:complete